MIPIQNIYYMLSYAFKVLNQGGYRNLDSEDFTNAADLMAAILIKGISSQIKRGLSREYLTKSDELSILRGKINLNDTIKTQSLIRKKVFCTYDDFSTDSYMNRIIKSTVKLLLKANISKSRKNNLRKLMLYFKDVKIIDLYKINRTLQYNRNNQTYQMLISICYFVVNGLVQTDSKGRKKLMDFFDDQTMSTLYEKFILEYYKKHYPDLSAKASRIPWALDDDFNYMLPSMITDIHLQKENDVLIIDAKYYSNTSRVNYNKHILHSNNLYQIFTYVKNRKYLFGLEENKVSGMLLYAKTDDIIYPNNMYKMHGNMICVRTLDLDLNFAQIAKQLDDIVEFYFKYLIKKF